MERLKYQLMQEAITDYDLHQIEAYMTLEELRDMKKKTFDYFSIRGGLKDEKDRALAEKMFRIGYMCAHTFYSPPEPLK